MFFLSYSLPHLCLSLPFDVVLRSIIFGKVLNLCGFVHQQIIKKTVKFSNLSEKCNKLKKNELRNLMRCRERVFNFFPLLFTAFIINNFFNIQ